MEERFKGPHAFPTINGALAGQALVPKSSRRSA